MSETQGEARPRVGLVTMPFVSSNRPSIQVGLLKAIACAQGFDAETLHLNLELVPEVGRTLYEGLCDHRGPLLGEWLFSWAAYGREAPDPSDRFLRAFSDCYRHLFEDPAAAEQTLVHLRREVLPRYVDRLAESVDWSRFFTVGFTSTFQQQVASVALARRIKARAPEVHIVFGGANHDADMGRAHLEGTPWIDFVVSGEAEQSFPSLLERLAEGGVPDDIPGVSGRRDGAVYSTPPGAPTAELDALPVPDYDEYFTRLAQLGGDPDAVPRPGVVLPFEAARGCWWGAKHHCVFCGLNSSTLAYRSKSPERVEEELATLSRRYRSFHLEAVDNILDHKYFDGLLPRLAAAPTSYRMMYEVKANLGRSQVELLQRAGVRQVQPGIESLSTQVLKLMRKGTTAAQNVNFLRWCQHYDVEASWNLLWGFPGETEEDYAAQLALLDKLVFLRPPHGGFRVWMERFSPLFRERDNFELRSLTPDKSYAYVYPDHYDLDRIAYFFEYELSERLSDDVYRPTKAFLRTWQNLWRDGPPPTLRYWWSPGFLQIEDRRYDPRGRLFTFDGARADAYVAAVDRPVSAKRIATAIDAGVEATQDILQTFVEHGLMMLDETRYLALALPAYRGAEGSPVKDAQAKAALPVVS